MIFKYRVWGTKFWEPDNIIARKRYSSEEFYENGEICENEIVLVLRRYT